MTPPRPWPQSQSVRHDMPCARGELSAAVIARLAGSPVPGSWQQPHGFDPLGADAQMALLVCYELHYRGFPEVSGEWEWDPGLLGFRATLEREFLAALRVRVAGGHDADGALDALAVEQPDAAGLSHHLRETGTWAQMCEYFAHRSIYQLKEADPYAWVIPRLCGQPKASLVAVEYDEFGAGRGDRVHSTLFVDLLDAAGLDSGYLAYVDAVPTETLAVANVLSLFGLHRNLRGALVGHFAVTEMSTGPSARRLVDALARMDAPAACTHFYAEHIEADAVHEQVLRHDVVRSLAEAEPALAADIVFGIQSAGVLEAALSEHLIGSWRAGIASLA